MPAVVIGRTEVAARLLAYTEKDKPGQGEPRVLYAEGIRCLSATATSEFRALRVKHGTQGAMRKVPARYELPRPGETATHVRHEQRSGRRVWRLAGPDEQATHVRRQPTSDVYVKKRVERFKEPRAGEQATHVLVIDGHDRPRWVEATAGQQATHVRHLGEEYYAKATAEDLANPQRYGGYEYVPQSEAVHLITSFGLDEVNPHDPEQVRTAFEFTVAMVRDLYPGVMAKLVGQADGEGMVADGVRLTEGGKFHVHAVLNATIVESMELDGKVWEPGRKMSGALTDIHRIRDRVDDFIDREGAAYGIAKNQVPVADQRRELRTAMDRRMAARGGKASRNDRLRDAWWEAIEDSSTVDLDTLKQAMAGHGIEVTEPGWRRGKPPKVRRLSYVFEGVTTRGQSLGELYDYGSTLTILEAKAMTGELPMRPKRAKAGPPKAVRPLGADEPQLALQAAEQLARDAMLQHQVEVWGQEEGVDPAELWAAHGWSFTDPAAREQMRQLVAQRHATERAELERESRAFEERRAVERIEEARIEAEQEAEQARQAEDERVAAELAAADARHEAEAQRLKAADKQRWAELAEKQEAQLQRQRDETAKQLAEMQERTKAKIAQHAARQEQYLKELGMSTPAEPEQPEPEPLVIEQPEPEAVEPDPDVSKDAEQVEDVDRQPVVAAPAPQDEQPAVAEQPLVEEDRPQAASRTSAPAPVSPAPASATAPAGGRRPFVSALRRRRAKSPKGQETIDRLAAFDETARARLLSGQRLREADVQAAGLGLRALEDYGRDLSDPVLEQVVLRLKKQRAARERFEDGTPGGRLVAEELRDEIALGLYEDLRGLPTSRRRIVVEMARDELAAEMAEREDFEFGD